jgi:transcriptional regulator with XRE-family HTH domain
MTGDFDKEGLLIAVGERMAERRRRLGLSQREVARRAGLHWTYIGTVEGGKRNLTLWNLARLAQALDYKDVGELMEGLGL